ncbi:transcriptional regulator, XRE family [Catenulispora acidiphila DSM 44928]|uniref:Transcriptional regulator, XRE family n=1 Tax=Catenulispora acidiphila (strain DSM 44928 / JCM 14897 / NBRC 102108 / NRRL B-24433 / ID139908) TaxID=479433 RepID=C7QJ41_CATAD|nr:helix-turn-helix transcriptional regulator [Catenulispora acidiphila]ACU69183.1 transcriptional regulator, XRE family [Catenulispora acidiphila DSM 44928]
MAGLDPQERPAGSVPRADQIERMMRRITDGHLRSTGRELTQAAVARYFGVSAETVRSWFSGRRNPGPDRVRDLARFAGVSPIEAFVDAGWLDESDVDPGRSGAGGGGDQMYAPEAAVHALLHDETMRARYAVRLLALESHGSYPLTTDVAAQFLLIPGAAVPALADVERLAGMARIVPSPSAAMLRRHPDYCAVRLELAAFVAEPLRWFGQYSWQGDAGSQTWRPAADRWPAQILVQDIVSGRSTEAAADGWSCRDQRPLVLIGGRYSSSMAAAMLAGALGWQFVLVHSGTVIDRSGQVVATRRDWLSGPAEAWREVAEHVGRSHAAGRPWPAVLAARPHSFLTPDGSPDHGALEQLRRTPARIVYARPHEAVLDWWTERQIGLSCEREYKSTALALRKQIEAGFDHIEEALRARAETISAERGREDLTIRCRRPSGALDPLRPQIPDGLVDDQVRLAWRSLTWLGHTSRHAAELPTRTPRSGPLRRFKRLLEADQEASLS